MNNETVIRTALQANYLNSLSKAADDARMASKHLIREATMVANFSSTSEYRPSIYAQVSIYATETTSVLNALMALAQTMGVSEQDFNDALDPGHVHFSEEN